MAGCSLPGGGATVQEPSAKPTIVIDSPPSGTDATVGEIFSVQSTAKDDLGVARIDLQVDGKLIQSDTTPNPDGQTSFALVQNWTPGSSGLHVVTVIAYRADGTASEPASITVNVIDPDAAMETTSTEESAGTSEEAATNCLVRATIDLNVRAGPGVDYAVIGLLGTDKTAPVIGRNKDETWWQVTYPSAPDGSGWVSGEYLTLEGECDDVPLGSYVPPPTTGQKQQPTPEAAPTGTVSPEGTPESSLPDLIVSVIDMPGGFHLPVDGSGTTVTVNVTVANIGSEPTGAFDIVLFPTGRGGPGGQVKVGTVALLPPGESIQLSVEYTYVDDGTFVVEAEADPDNVVEEGDEGNNIRTFVVTVILPTATPKN
jgi:hypothetical protein